MQINSIAINNKKSMVFWNFRTDTDITVTIKSIFEVMVKNYLDVGMDHSFTSGEGLV